MRTYAVLIDTGCAWPDVSFVGSLEDAVEFTCTVPDHYVTSIRAVVSLAEIEGEVEDEVDSADVCCGDPADCSGCTSR